MFADGPPARSSGIWYGEDLFWHCQRLAETQYPATSGQGKHPSGALIYYIVRQVMLRIYPGAVIEPDANLVPQALAEHFLALAPQIAQRLAEELKHALRLIDRTQVADELQRVMRRFARVTLPQVHWATEHHVGIYEPLRQHLQRLWETFWDQVQVERVKLLRLLLGHPEYLLVRPIAPPGMSGKAALKRLRQVLADDKTDLTWAALPPGCYLYNEPLQDWLLRPLLTGQLFIDLCNVLADLTRAVPALVHQRWADMGVTEDDAVSPSPDMLKQALLRRLPMRPKGMATGTTIAFYAIAAWRVARHTAWAALGAPAHPAGTPDAASDEPTPPGPAQPEDSGEYTSARPAGGDDLILPDQRVMPLSQFQHLLEYAMQAAEHLIWDDTLAISALPTSSAEQRRLLRQSLLSARMRRQFDTLSQMERHRAAQLQATLPTWTAWETWRDATCDTMAMRLASSIVPATITSADLPDLLRLPTADLVSQYLYQMTTGAWLRGALQATLFDGSALLAWCRALAEALAQQQGAWPPQAPGAPGTVEQAALATLWYVKLALEARTDRFIGFIAPAGRPKRTDGGLVVWLESILPVEALELATIIAPLVARMLYHSAREASDQGEALFIALMMIRDQRSYERLAKELRLHAEDLNLSNPTEAVQQALVKLENVLERILLPDEISLDHLMGEKSVLISLDLSIDSSYTLFQRNYQFIGDFKSFIKSFIRPQDSGEVPPDEAVHPDESGSEADPNAARVSSIALDPVVENDAALRLLELLLTNAQTPDGELARDARRLIEWAFTTNTGRQMIERFAREGRVVAIELTRLWQADILPAEGAEPAISPRLGKVQMKQQVALARFLISAPVQRSPAVRRAVSDLFEIPMALKTPQLVGPRLGDFEHLAPWATRKALREEALRILAALEQVPPRQREAICKRLLTQKQIVLTLHLLQRWGWSRPDWFRSPDAKKQYSSQIFLYARQSWQHHLVENDANWRARALMAEWLRMMFWGQTWRAQLAAKHVSCFYQTLLDALHPRLRAVLAAVGGIAMQEGLASFAEVIGVEGCLPPQLPAQLDDPVYFEAMWNRFTSDVQQLYEDNESDEQPLARLRQDWQVTRMRTHLWFLTLAGLADENEQRLLLAAMSLANGNARLMDRWLGGHQPAAAEAQQLLDHVKQWNPQSTLTAQNIPDLLGRAAERVRAAWAELRASPK